MPSEPPRLQSDTNRSFAPSFRLELPLASVQEALARGEEHGTIHDWTM
jgi:hypothetical protein